MCICDRSAYASSPEEIHEVPILKKVLNKAELILPRTLPVQRITLSDHPLEFHRGKFCCLSALAIRLSDKESKTYILQNTPMSKPKMSGKFVAMNHILF